jgi:diguanylate cyclase (GGDEF)-like protein
MTENSPAKSRTGAGSGIAVRRATAYFAASLLLLAGVAAYLLLGQRRNIWNAAHQNALNIALGLETGATALLQQPRFSLQGVRTDLGGGAGANSEQTLRALRDAVRFDPVSQYLGVRMAAGGEVMVVDSSGNRGSSQLETRLRRAIPARIGPGVALHQLIRLPQDTTWYLPLTLTIPNVDATENVAFALVPARRLVAGTESLRLMPHSRVSLVATDGTRLLGYSLAPDVLEVNGPRMPPELLKRAVERTGVGELIEPVTGVNSIVGYSRSPTLPLFVGTVVPVSSVEALWRAQAMAPVIVLTLGLLGIGFFGLQLRSALQRQQIYVAEQEYLAAHDTLTGLLNRDAFMRLLERSTASSPPEPFAVVLLDLNRFKDINDTLGHGAGDRVLEEVGRRMNHLLHAGEARVARVGGDELAILVHDAEYPEAIETFCKRVQACLAEPIRIDGVELSLTASMGAALYPADAQTPAELLRRADVAMYSARGALRSYSRYSRVMDNFTAEMLALKAEFARALREGGLSIVYQPKVRLSSGRLVGLEALSRWFHPNVGAVPPATYVRLAESSELIHPFTLFMLHSAAGQIARWRDAGHAVPVSVNISPNNLLDHAFVDKLAAVLEDAALPGHLLELEVTESAVMHHPEIMLRRLHDVRELGVHLSLDDFGTGYASLAYLKSLPVDTLKIDKSFVVNLADDEADQRIVRSSIQLAHGFGMTVVAEGVESEKVAERLMEYRCDYAQGFHYARPVPAAEIEAHWLRSPSAA